MAAELPRPGVEVIQVFRSTSPTVVTPTLPSCIVGVCRQVVDVVTSGVINSQALMTLPAAFVAKAPTVGGEYSGLDGLNFKFSVNYSATPVTVPFADAGSAGLSPTDIVNQINAALLAAGEGAALAEVTGLTWRLRSVAVGDNETLQIIGGTGGTAAAVSTAFGLPNIVATTAAPVAIQGLSSYGQCEIALPTTSFPDPRSNLEELAIEPASVKVYLATGSAGALRTLSRTQAFLRRSVTNDVITMLDDGNGDNFTPLFKVTNVGGDPNYTTAGAACVRTGAGAPDYTNLDNKTLVLGDGREPKTIVFGAVAVMADVLGPINAAFDPNDGIVATDNGGGFLRLTSTRKREDGTTAAAGSDSAIVIYGGTAVSGVANYLDVGATPLLAIGRYEGTAHPVAPGDEVFADGKSIGKVVQVAPSGANNILKLDTQQVKTFTAAKFYIIAKNLGAVSATRPRPELTVDTAGNVTVANAILRDTTGAPVEAIKVVSAVSTLVPIRALTYLAYTAVRLDVSAQASSPGLLRLDDTTQLESILSPVSAANPLALGTYFALLNSPGTQTSALGVDAVSADSPYGTVEAFTRAFEYLEASEVYAIAPLTHDESVAQVAATHATVMSEPSNKGERIVLFNRSRPTSKVDTLVASGLNGQSGASATTFDTGIANLAAILLAAGVDPTVTIPVTSGVFLDIASDSKKYSVTSISGSVLTLKVAAFAVGENTDSFYATAAPASGLVNEVFALRIRGASLTLTDGSADKTSMAETYQKIGQGYANRRFWHIVPDKCAATIGGIEQELEGFYMAAAYAGLIASQPPQQSFTNFPLTGFTKVKGANDYFSSKQLDVIAAGGNWIVMQEGDSTPLFARMALTTDVTSIETRTDSITKVVDFTAKFLRSGLKNFIGRFNITQGFLDSLGHVVQGLGTLLTDTGVLIGFNLNNIIQDENAPDTVMIDVTLDVPFPCNYIRLTLAI